MRVLLVHNYYQLPGGEDDVFRQEGDLLRSRGHIVVEYVRRNSDISSFGPIRRLGLAAGTTWAFDTYRELRSLISFEQPDVAHFHNTFPLISPSAYYACRRAGVPVVQTLHNPRIMCPAATFFRDGLTCQDCVGKLFPWPGILHRCYRHSAASTAAVGIMQAFHHMANTWEQQVSLFVASTEFYRGKFIEGGLPPHKIAVKPHFVFADPGPRSHVGEYALYVGRLAAEKGVPTLLKAWGQLNGVPLKIRGTGPLLLDVLGSAARPGKQVQVMPPMTHEALMGLVKQSRFLVWPSEGLYETFGLVAIQAFACGVPVIASRIGVMESVVTHGNTGLLFDVGNSADLACKVSWAWRHPEEMASMGRNARAEFEQKYTAAKNYDQLMAIYDRVLAEYRGAASRS